MAVAVSTAGDGDFLAKYLASSRWPGFGLDRELYDHQSDPDEITNLADRPEQAETVAKLSQQLADYVRLKPYNRQQGLDGGNPLLLSDFCNSPRALRPGFLFPQESRLFWIRIIVAKRPTGEP